MAMIKKTSPWVEYYYQVKSLFREDPEVHVMLDEEEQQLKVYVEDGVKADALDDLLPEEKVWGNVTYKVTVVPPNGFEHSDFPLDEAFNKNTAVVDIVHVDFMDIAYVIFKKTVLQYYDDSLSSAYGVKSTLYEDIARAVLEPANGVFYCTDIQGGDDVIIGGKMI